MAKFLLRRLVQFPLILAVIYLTTYLLAWVVPGNPFQRSERAVDPATLAAMRQDYHADDPWAFLAYYPIKMVQGDFGRSFGYPGTTVREILDQTLPVSLGLGAFAILIAVAAGVLIGTMAAVYGGRTADWLSLGVALAGVSIPSFVIAAGLLSVVYVVNDTASHLTFHSHGGWPSVKYDASVSDGTEILPLGNWPRQDVVRTKYSVAANGRVTDWGRTFTNLPDALWQRLRHGLLPALALSLLPMAYIARLTRVSMIDVLGSDYVRTARAKGLTKSRVIFKHCLRNALLPVLSFLGPAAAGTLVGSFVVEQVFSIPGLGYFFVKSVQTRDQPLILASVMVYSVLLLTLNLLVDVAYTVVDPRIEA